MIAALPNAREGLGISLGQVVQTGTASHYASGTYGRDLGTSGTCWLSHEDCDLRLLTE